MKFKVSFTVDSGFLGPILASLFNHPIEEFDLQGDILNELTDSVSQIRPSKNVRQSRGNQQQRDVQPIIEGHEKPRKRNLKIAKPTLKDAIWNFMILNNEPQSMKNIRVALVKRGYNPLSIPSSFQVLRNSGKLKLMDDNNTRPQRYIAVQ